MPRPEGLVVAGQRGKGSGKPVQAIHRSGDQ